RHFLKKYPKIKRAKNCMIDRTILTKYITAMLYDRPTFKEQYDNYIGGKFVPPVDGEYFDDISPVDGKPFTKVARSNEKDIERALDAAHEAAEDWNKASAQERSAVLLKIADIMEENLE